MIDKLSAVVFLINRLRRPCSSTARVRCTGRAYDTVHMNSIIRGSLGAANAAATDSSSATTSPSCKSTINIAVHCITKVRFPLCAPNTDSKYLYIQQGAMRLSGN